ncbi:MAG: hypothetical protein HGA51_10470, partial [Demequinaceae bacterium]|nr:hypothetical protein [Demequinaceae bacterium]
VLSRPRVTTKALAALNVGAAALLLGWARANGNGEYWPRAVYFAATVVFALSLYVLTSRALVRVVIALGNALIRRGQRVLVAAGSGLVQHPRNAASIATSIAVGGIGAGALLWWWFVRPQGAGTELAPRAWSEIIENAGLTTLLTATVLGTASAVLSLAIWIGRGRVAGDAAIYGALGLGGRDRQLAAMTQVAIASFAGGAGGLIAGTAGAALANGILAVVGTWEFPFVESPVGVATQGLVVWLGALLGIAVVSAATSLAAARASDGKNPSALRRSASREGANF